MNRKYSKHCKNNNRPCEYVKKMRRLSIVDINKVRDQLSVESKNGIGFLLSAIVIWFIITIIFLQSFSFDQKNLYMLISTGLMFPLYVAISHLLKADWKLENNPFGQLGLHLNIAQIIYFPILIWGILKSPDMAIMFFAIITGAHLYPYGWLYHAKAYYILAPIISVMIMMMGLLLSPRKNWLIPLAMVVFIALLVICLCLDYKSKMKKTR